MERKTTVKKLMGDFTMRQRFQYGLSLLIGFVALVWFLIRVIPKPSRAAYPCQRAAFPIASAFVLYLAGLLIAGQKLFLSRRHRFSGRLMKTAAAFSAGCAILFLLSSLNPMMNQASTPPVASSDTPNTPIGEAKGIFPGRVVWAHDPNATRWDPAWNDQSEFFYWDSDHTDGETVTRMLSDSLLILTNRDQIEEAWDDLFRYFNRTHGKGDIGYQSGERVVIKVNHNNQWDYTTYSNQWADSPPCLYVALLDQLVTKAGIPQDCITLTDPLRYVDDKTYDACHAVFPNVQYEDSEGTAGRVRRQYVSDRIYWSGIDESTGETIKPYPVARSHVEADYLINLGRLQGHNFAGVSFTAKNWFGSFGITPYLPLHVMIDSPYQSAEGYQVLVDLIGHRYLGGKTLLYILDGLWGFRLNGRTNNPPTWYDYPPFNHDYPSSLLVSQDPVAIDSVAYDFYASQYFVNDMWYLHEAAMADNPPSGIYYDPEGDAVGMESLGVHEHWNNPGEKLYSRNLGTGVGIELIQAAFEPPEPNLPGDIDGDGRVALSDLLRMANAWTATSESPQWDDACDIAPPAGNQVVNYEDLFQLSRSWMQTNNSDPNSKD